MRYLSALFGAVLILTLVAPAGAAEDARQAGSPPGPGVQRELMPLLDAGQGAPTAMPEAPAANIVPWARFVFQSYRDGNWEIYRANPDGTGVVRLTDHPALDKDARLNRGATRIVFASDRNGGDFDIFTMNPDGGNVTPLINDSTDDQGPVWSPDGSRIAFESYRDGIDNGEIYVMSANGSGQTRLTNSPGYDIMPAWSPDGGKIAFVSNRGGPFRVMVMNADGSNQQALSNQHNAYDPVFSPDGQQIAYDADNDGDGREELWLMNADGSSQHLIYDPGNNVVAWARSWSPDGRYLAYSEIQVQGQYWTSGTVRVWDSANPGSVQDLTPGTLDWKPDLETSDAAAPTSSVQAMPSISPGPLNVRWSGSDSGGAGLKNFDVQVKDGANGAWTNWQSGVAGLSAAYSGVGGHTYYFRSRARDNAFNVEAWPAGSDAMTMVENLPPRTTVERLAPYSRNGVTVRWGGVDPGGSGIKSYDVQTRQGNGAWTNWKTNTTDTSATYTGTPGTEVSFRVRARDNADNLEAWPAAADTSTVLYTWGVSGAATDNRGAPVAGMTVTTAPQAIQQATSDGDGVYAAYVAAAAAAYSVSWNKAGYGALPATTFAPLLQDPVVDVVLLPADNAIANGDFESGTLSPAWQAAGSPLPMVTVDTWHTGQYGAYLSATSSRDAQVATVAIAQQTTVAGGLTAPTLSFAYRLLNPWPASDDRLAVEIDAAGGTTVVFSRSATADAWTHQWVDLTPWLGQAITVRFRLDRVSAGSSVVHLDEVSVGSAYPDVWVRPVSGAAPPGAQLHTALVYGNRGGVAAAGGSVTLELPAGLSFVSATPPPTATTPVLRWDAGPFPAFSQAYIDLTLQVSAGAAVGNSLNTTAAIATTSAELETADNTAAGSVFVGSRSWLPFILH